MISDGTQIDLLNLLQLKFHLACSLGFTKAKRIPSHDGRTFFVRLSGLTLDSFRENHLTGACASALKILLDSSKTLMIFPSSMEREISGDDGDGGFKHLVGALMCDVVALVMNDPEIVYRLPDLEQVGPVIWHGYPPFSPDKLSSTLR